jgi:hypothetical protein|tara:strand:- start:316 stop:714 length:399 start_codon:yes stop_codon:yes gene_type:complete
MDYKGNYRMSVTRVIDIRDPRTRLTAKRRAGWIDEAMAQAAAIEGRRRERLLQRMDVERLVDAVRAVARTGAEIRKARSYARNGEFVANSYGYYAPITACVVGARGQPEVAVFDAKRPNGRAASVTVNGRAV